jgi:hypothetical protein
VRARLGLEAELGYGWTTGMRLVTGNARDAVSTNQTLGNAGSRYQVALDLAYLRWAYQSATGRNALSVSAGRIASPWYSTDLVWDSDLTFEGVAANYRYSLSRDDPFRRNVYATVGVFPLEEVELSSKDKWLYGAQVGVDWRGASGNRYRVGAAYYGYANTAGRRNSLDSSLLDFTAPRFLQRGNTLFDIRNDVDPTTNLFALAADYKLVNLTAAVDWQLSSEYRVGLSADAVKNIGYDSADVLGRTGLNLEERSQGYQAEIGFGTTVLARERGWRAFVGYRYLERDAVLDAFTDSDFRLGGTDVEGFYVGGDYAFSPRSSIRLRYLSGGEIDGPPLGIDLLQLDFNTQF